MTSRLTDARQRLADAIAVRYQVDRTHDVTPNQVVAPCVFLGGVSLDRASLGTPGTPVVIATFPVYVVADGRPDEQTRKIDELLAFVWDAAFDCGAMPIDAVPAAIDVGGPNLRGAICRVELTITAATLCPPSMEVVSG
jgi:hypothetical protein